jgi:hypothetical protein
MHTKNGDLVMTDQVQGDKDARHLGISSGNGGLRGRLMRAEEAQACEQSRLSMSVVESAERGVEQV